MKIETERLILRPPRRSDWKAMVEGMNDFEISKNFESIPYPFKRKDAELFIKEKSKEWKKKKKSNYHFMIELKSEKKIIGASGFNKIDNFVKKATSGSWISRKYWRKGYITEAKIAINDFAFNNLKMQKLETDTFVENKRSNRMSKKLGYKFEGTRRRSNRSRATKKWHDANNYGLLKEEWKKVRSKLIKELKAKIKRETKK